MVDQAGPKSGADAQDNQAMLNYFLLQVTLDQNGALALQGSDGRIEPLSEGLENVIGPVIQNYPEETQAHIAKLYGDFLGTEGAQEKFGTALATTPDYAQTLAAQGFASALNAQSAYPDIVVQAMDVVDAPKGGENPELIAQAMEQEPEAFQAALTEKFGEMFDPDGDGVISQFDLDAAQDAIDTMADLSLLDDAINDRFLEASQNAVEALQSGTAGFEVSNCIAPVFAQAADGGMGNAPALDAAGPEISVPPAEDLLKDGDGASLAMADTAEGVDLASEDVFDIDPSQLQINGEDAAPVVAQLQDVAAPKEQMGATPIVLPPVLDTALGDGISYSTDSDDPLAPSEVVYDDPAVEPRTYTVESGDALSLIADCAYPDQGDDMSTMADIQKRTEALAEFNGISDINDIRAGQVLVLPPRDVMEQATEDRIIAGDWTKPGGDGHEFAASCGLCVAPVEEQVAADTSDVTISSHKI